MPQHDRFDGWSVDDLLADIEDGIRAEILAVEEDAR